MGIKAVGLSTGFNTSTLTPSSLQLARKSLGETIYLKIISKIDTPSSIKEIIRAGATRIGLSMENTPSH